MTSDRTGLSEIYPASWRWLRIARRIAGWLSDAEGNALFELARQRAPEQDAVVVELGSWQGKSSVLLAAGLSGKHNPRLVCIDPFGEDENSRYQTEFYGPVISTMRLSLEEIFCRNIRRCGLTHIVQPIKAYSFDAVRNWREPIDILFIDASHEYESVHRDLLLWSPFVKLGGIVALHDVSPNWPGPSRVMAEDLQPPYFGDLEQTDSLLRAVKKSSGPLGEQRELAVITIPKCDFDRRQQEIARLSVDLSDLKEELHRAAGPRSAAIVAEMRRSKAALAEAQQANADLRASWSWRITAPLRLVLDATKSLARNPARLLRKPGSERGQC
jgi:predicted O-methyltransferase YrrM